MNPTQMRAKLKALDIDEPKLDRVTVREFLDTLPATPPQNQRPLALQRAAQPDRPKQDLIGVLERKVNELKRQLQLKERGRIKDVEAAYRSGFTQGAIKGQEAARRREERVKIELEDERLKMKAETDDRIAKGEGAHILLGQMALAEKIRKRGKQANISEHTIDYLIHDVLKYL